MNVYVTIGLRMRILLLFKLQVLTISMNLVSWRTQFLRFIIDLLNKYVNCVLERASLCLVWLKSPQGGFPIMAEITRILAANICRQFFFVITTTASTRCLVQNFQLICFSQRVSATWQYNDSSSSTCSKWPNDRMVAVVKHCWLLIQGKRGCR